MKKIFTSVLCAVVAASCLLAGCGGSSGSDNAVSAAVLGEAMVAASGSGDNLVLLDDNTVFDFYTDLDSSLTDDCQVYYNLVGNSVEEIAVFHATSSSNKKLIEAAINNRLAVVGDQLERYPADREDEFRMYESRKILEKGDYIALVITTDVGAVEKAFKDCF